MSIFTRKSVDTLRADAAANPLRRVLGPLNLTTLGIGSIIGTGIFVLTGTAASQNAGPSLIISMIIAGVAIPASVIATFGMMWALDFTLNGVTMLALVLMVGIVIDDAIVVLENIFRFVEEKKMDTFEAARAATAEIGLAVLATTLSLVVIFLPVSFMSSISGRFLYQFGVTAAVAVMVSLLVSFTLTPMMSARFLRAEKPHDGPADAARSRTGFYARIDRAYAGALVFAMRHRLMVALIAVAVIASSVPLYGLVKQEYIPSDVDEAELEVRVTGPLSASIGAMDEVMRQSTPRCGRARRAYDARASRRRLHRWVSSGEAYVRIAPHEERLFSTRPAVARDARRPTTRSVSRQLRQREVMLEIRAALRRYRDLRIR